MKSIQSLLLTAATAATCASAIHLPPASLVPHADIFNTNTNANINININTNLNTQQRPLGGEPTDIKVPVQLGVMSKCPDALLCERRFTEVLEQVSDKVDLSLVYVGK